MASSSSAGDGPSTSGGRSERVEQYWDFVPATLTATRASEDALQELLIAVISSDIVQAKKAAKKLEKKGKTPDEAVRLEAIRNPKSKLHGPLHAAAAQSYLEMCKMLVKDFKCDPNATNADDATPLYFAIQGGSLPVVKYLIKRGANPEKANNRGTTPLHNAARRGFCGIAGYLLSIGVNVDPICQDGETPLHFAALHGHAEMVQLLLDHNADLNRLSHDLHTPLVTSLFSSSLGCLQTFIQAGANVNTGPVTPLSIAARKGSANCIRCLLDNNADPNASNEYGKLPLEIAASKGWVECFEVLLPVTNPLEKYGNLGLKQVFEQEKTVRILEEHMAIVEGDFAFWEKEYTHALECYNHAMKLGHQDPSLYAKRSLCRLYNHEQLRYLDDALSYMNLMYPEFVLPCSEDDAKQSVLEYAIEWKTRNMADEFSREEHP